VGIVALRDGKVSAIANLRGSALMSIAAAAAAVASLTLYRDGATRRLDGISSLSRRRANRRDVRIQKWKAASYNIAYTKING
jgi:hypothetical protein